MTIPFSDPPWIALPSPYYNQSHRRWQKTCRAFIEENLLVNAMEWDKEETLPDSVFKKFAENNMLLPALPAPLPVQWLKKLGIHDILGVVKVEEWDYFHTAIFFDEVCNSLVSDGSIMRAEVWLVLQMHRSGLAGPPASITAGPNFGIPPILNFGSKQLQDKYLPELLLGKKRSCIAITEPSAGSDVANIQTTAKKSSDGKYYIINGTKKWITTGIWTDYSTMAVRTGGPGAGGLSMMVVPLKNYPGVTMYRLKVQGQTSGGTSFIELDDVKVPVENLIGQEGMGMKVCISLSLL